jgi:hypothetical protein
MSTQFNKLIVSGCSFASGYKLEYGKESAWPKLLSDKLSIPVVNLSEAGRGNSYVFSSIVDYFIENPSERQTSLVIIGVTGYHRQDFYDSYGKNFISTVPEFRNGSSFIESFWKRYYNDEYYFTNYLRSVVVMQEYLKSNSIKCLMFNALNTNRILKRNLSELDQKYIESIDTELFLKMTMCDFIGFTPRSVLDDGHPSELGHKIMAEVLYANIKTIFD